MKDRAWEKITNEKNLFECPARHDKVLLENVTTFRIPEVSPCPCCLQQAKAEESEKLDLSPSRKLDTYGGTFNAGLYPLMDDIIQLKKQLPPAFTVWLEVGWVKSKCSNFVHHSTRGSVAGSRQRTVESEADVH